MVDSESVTLDAGDSETVSFTVTATGEGSHTVEIGDASASYTVEAVPEPSRFPTMYVAVGVVIIVAAVYLYMQQQKPE